jgi:prepilin-type N-terminal cleavage/methylation domain-containing protein
MKRGFTIIELALVLAVMGVLVAATAPTIHFLMLNARTSEARTMLSAIAHAELRHRRDHGQVLACPAEGEVPKGPVRFPSERPCWKALGVETDGEVRYRYSVVVGPSGWTALAEGDLDGDGVTSTFSLDGATLALTVAREFE